MNILVIGSTGGSGLAAVQHLLAEGHAVTAFSRHASRSHGPAAGLTARDGDVMDAEAVAQAVRGHDAVVVTLGISENPLRVRLFGPARTPPDVRSRGTANVVAAMRLHGVKRLVVQTSYGVGATRDRLGLIERLFFALVLKPQIADTEVQERAVLDSDLDWVVVQPVHLTNDVDGGFPCISTEGATGRMSVARDAVGRFLAVAATQPTYVRRCVAVSGAPKLLQSTPARAGVAG
jgi:uncharacterized protein YbjT (DUF2867 family)